MPLKYMSTENLAIKSVMRSQSQAKRLAIFLLLLIVSVSIHAPPTLGGISVDMFPSNDPINPSGGCAASPFTITFADAVASCNGLGCLTGADIEGARVNMEVGRIYRLTVAGANVCSIHLRFGLPSCYAFSTNGSPNLTSAIDQGGAAQDHAAEGTWTVRLLHKYLFEMQFDTERDGDAYVLPADNVSVTHPYINTGNPFLGLTYPLTWTIESDDKLNCQINATNGMIRAGDKAGVITVKVTDSSTPPCEVLGDLELRRCTTCDAASCSISSVLAVLGSVDASVSLGVGARGESMGTLSLHSTNWSANLGSPLMLRYNYRRGDAVVLTNALGMKQVKVPQGLAHIEIINSGKYEIRFYRPWQVGVKTNGFYSLTNSPFSTVVVDNPSSGNLTITDGNGVAYSYSFSTNLSFPRIWTLNSASGVRTETRGTVWSETNVVRTVVDTITDGAGKTNAVRGHKFRTFTWGEAMVEEWAGVGSDARTNYTTYSADGLRRDTSSADGSWSIAFFDTHQRITNLFSSIADELPTTNKSNCRFIDYLYPDGFYDRISTNVPLRITEYVLNREVARTYNKFSSYAQAIYRCVTTNASYSHGNNLITQINRYSSDTNYRRLYQIVNPDLTFTDYQYSDDVLSNIVSQVGNGPGWDGTQTTTVVSTNGQLKTRTVTDGITGKTNALELFSMYDEFNRPLRVQYLDGTSTFTQYGCCGVQSITNREGTVTWFTNDILKRAVQTLESGILSTTVLDADGNVLARRRRGTDGTTVTTVTNVYNTAGRLTQSTDALNRTTTYAESGVPVTRTITFPDGGTRIEQYYRDGSLRQVGGTAAFPRRYEYGATNGVANGLNCNLIFTKEIKLDATGADTSEWTMTLSDMVGRLVKTVEAAASGQSNAVNETIFYNGGESYPGRLARTIDPDGVMVDYSYNVIGEIEFVAVDLEHSSTPVSGILYSTSNRVTRTQSSATAAHGFDVRHITTKVATYDTGGSADFLVLTQDRSLDGLRSWFISFNGTNKSQTMFTNGSRYVVDTAPDGTATISCFSTGRLISVQVTNANLGSLRSTTYGYDAHGRQTLVTDARTGTTTNVFANADQLTDVFTPSPGGGQASLRTQYHYDAAGRLDQVTRPDGGVVTQTYYTNGLLRHRQGSRVYPVDYGYDAQGRLTNQVTWANYSGSLGSETTRWYYDSYRGFMTAKVFPNGMTNSFSYTNSGRLVRRTWARGTTTTYTYNAAGEIGLIDYSDNTLDLAYSYDRRGRMFQLLQGTNVNTFQLHDSGLVLKESLNGQTLLTNRLDSLLRRTRVYANTPSSDFNDFAYDAASRLSGVTNSDYEALYSYLTNSPLVSSVSWHRANNSPALDVYPLITTRTYDSLDRLTAIVHAPGSSGTTPGVTFRYGYNTAGQRTAVTNYDSSRWSYGYDALGQLITGKHFWSNNVLAAGQQFEYTFDDIGNRQSALSGGNEWGSGLRPQSYSANTANQYTQRTVPGYVDVLNQAGNDATVTVNNQRVLAQNPSRDYFRTELLVNNATGAVVLGVTNIGVLQQPYAFPPYNVDIVTTNLFQAFVSKTPELFGYDADGNVTNNGRLTFKWDAENHLTEIESGPAVPAALRQKLVFNYDYQGRRVSKTISNWVSGAWQLTNSLRWIWDNWRPLAELELTNGALRGWYVWGLDESRTMDNAGGVGGLLALYDAHQPSHATYFCVADGQGNISGLMDLTGSAVERLEYGPFGEPLRGAGAPTSLRWSSKYEDAETGLLYYGYRYYDPANGRWLNRDPISESGGLNLYAFVKNNPVNTFDRLGLALYAFDGTGNNDREVSKGRFTWVLTLAQGYLGEAHYEDGVGSSFGEKSIGGLTGLGARTRLERAYEEFLNNYKNGDKEIDIIGFSRGAAMAREFANMIYERGDGSGKYTLTTSLGKGQTISRTIYGKPCVIPPIRYVGLFDTVASFGIPGNQVNINYRLDLPPNVKVARHAVAADEQRYLFPSTPLNQGRSDQDFGEELFPGDHSDIGRGYGNDTRDLSFEPLYYIWSEGIAAGVPFGPLPGFSFMGNSTPHNLSLVFPYNMFPKRLR